MAKVVIISTVFPFPVDNGKKVVLSGLLDYFIETVGEDNVKYILLGQQSESIVGKYKLLNRDEISKPHALIQIKNVLLKSLLLRQKSIQEAVLYSESIKESLIRLIKEEDSDLILYDTVRIGQFFENCTDFNGKEYLYLDDLFSIRYGKMLETTEKYPDIKLDALGNFKKFVPKPIRPSINVNFIQRLLLKLEMNLIEKSEIAVVDRFQNNLLISKDEVAYLQNRTSKQNIKEVKPLVNYKQNYSRKYEGAPTFIFLGSLNIPHNEASIFHFIESQLQELGRLIPNFKLLIIGKNASSKLIKLCEEYSKYIEIKGYVEDLSTVFDSASAMIVPLLFGSGVKLKTLEALSSGLPIISTDYGVEGINIESGYNCIVENDISEYPKIMLNLCDIEYNSRISKNARSSFIEMYSKEVVFEEYKKIFRNHI